MPKVITAQCFEDNRITTLVDDNKRPTTFATHTFGCKVNQAETEMVASELRGHGLVGIDSAHEADAVLVNTCAVTSKSEQKARRFIREVLRENNNALVFVAGCYAQTLEHTRDITSARLKLHPSQDKAGVADLVLSELSARPQGLEVLDLVDGELGMFALRPRTKRTRALIKVQDGCDQFCGYCAVPNYRQELSSRPVEDIVSEILNLVSSGHREIMMTGVNLSLYGIERGAGDGQATLVEMLGKAASLPGEYRLRLSSVELNAHTKDLWKVLPPDLKLARHFHIPLQSGSDYVLSAMGRKYSSEEFIRFVNDARRLYPGAAFTTDVIVGFPGETRGDVARTVDVLRQLMPHRVHIFKYSERKGTKATELPEKVREDEKNERSETVRSAAASIRESVLNAQLGRIFEVVAEEVVEKDSEVTSIEIQQDRSDQVVMEGYSSEYFRVRFPAARHRTGELVSVKVTSRVGNKLIGEVSA